MTSCEVKIMGHFIVSPTNPLIFQAEILSGTLRKGDMLILAHHKPIQVGRVTEIIVSNFWNVENVSKGANLVLTVDSDLCIGEDIGISDLLRVAWFFGHTKIETNAIFI